MDAARNTDRSAIEIALSIFKTSTLLNGGAIVAIPAVVTLFRIDVSGICAPLLFAGGIFAGGLIASWLSAVFGFFALANRADSESSDAVAMKWRTNLSYYPPDNTENGQKERGKAEAEIKKSEDKIAKFHKRFWRNRALAILFSIISLLAFIGGNAVGGWTILSVPQKSIAEVKTLPLKKAPTNAVVTPPHS